jgi:hypothetical protein
MIDAKSLFLAGFAIGFMAPHVSMASTVFSSFMPGNTYLCCEGAVVSGASTGGSPFGLDLAAVAFTPADDFNLTQIDVGFYYIGGTNDFSLTLVKGSSGAPGTTPIETWTGLIAPRFLSGTSSIVETVSPVTTVSLLAGQQYWIVASAALNSEVVWAKNSALISQSAPIGIAAIMGGDFFGPDWSIFPAAPGEGDLAFDVKGTTPSPEPNTFTLIAAGCSLTLIGLIRKK